jgi:V-type ATP synthase alpha chain
LQQNAFMESDTYTSLEKQDKMLALVLKFYDEGIRGLNNGAYLNEIVDLAVRERIARAKYLPESELSKIDEISKELTEQIDNLINKGGALNA